jgi:zinc protease
VKTARFLAASSSKEGPRNTRGAARGAWLGVVLLFTLMGRAAAAEIPPHPSLLKFEPLNYQPPKAAQHRHVLSNGAVAYLVEDHAFPLVNVSVLIRAGRYLDPPGKAGLAAAVGNQLRAGGTAGLNAREFDEEADFLAANINAMIGETQGTASLNCLARNLDASLKLFFDMLRNPAFDPQRLSIYKARVLQSLARRNDQTAQIEAREFARLLRGDKHFSTVPETKASLESITREDLVAFHKRYFHPAGFIFAVSGDFDTREIIARLEQGMKDWDSPRVEVPQVPRPDYTPKPGFYLINKPEVNQCRVSIGHSGVMRDNPDHFALEILDQILGAGVFTSRIGSRVRAEEGLAYDARSTMTFGIYYEGVFRAFYQSRSATCAQAAAIVLEEINRIRKEKVTQEELNTAINYAVEIFPRFFATPSIVAATFASDEYTKRPADYWETYRDRLRAVTADDVLRAAQKYVHPERLVTLIVGNAGDVLKGDPNRPQYSFQKLAGAGGIQRLPLPDPVTMVYPPN